MATINEANAFLSSFANLEARSFVLSMLRKNYAEAIFEHHPSRERLEGPAIQQKCDTLIDTVFDGIEKVGQQPEKLFPLFLQLSRSNEPRDKIWFDEFIIAYQNYKHHKKLINRHHQLKPFLQGNSYCDIGCGGGDLVAYLGENHPAFKEVAGIDIMDWRTEEIKGKIDFQQLDFSRPGTSSQKQYDTLTCLAVFHHVGNTDDEMNDFLQNLRTALTDKGRLILEEDVIMPKNEIEDSQDIKRQIAYLRSKQIVYDDFLNFNKATQRDIIVLIDFLANCLSVGVPEMPFPCGFRSVNNWISIFERNGYVVDQVKIWGFVKGNFNQSSHVFFVLNKNGPGT